jgi:hypothetical protein
LSAIEDASGSILISGVSIVGFGASFALPKKSSLRRRLREVLLNHRFDVLRSGFDDRLSDFSRRGSLRQTMKFLLRSGCSSGREFYIRRGPCWLKIGSFLQSEVKGIVIVRN